MVGKKSGETPKSVFRLMVRAVNQGRAASIVANQLL